MQIKRGNNIVEGAENIWLQKESFLIEEIMGDHLITIDFLLKETVEFRIHDYIVFEDNTYKIRHNEDVTKEETSLGWKYRIIFYSSQYELQDVTFFLNGKPERKKNVDYYTGTASEVLSLIVKNMNRNSSGWKAGNVIETERYTFNFRDKSCAEVITEVARAFDTEFWVSGKFINIGKREYESDGLVLGQGQGRGFKELKLSSVDDNPPITILYAYGSDKNITIDYGHDYLVLPGGKLFLERNVDKYGKIEASKQFEDIYPYGEFFVEEVIDKFSFIAKDVDFNIKDYQIEGIEAIVTFQTGELAGYDLSIADWDNEIKKLTLNQNKDENALNVPGDINFKAGDKFYLFNVRFPEKYILKAENRLEVAADKYLSERCDKRVQLTGKCDDTYFKTFGVHVACGKLVGIVSDELEIDREIRCTRVKKFLENNRPPYRYEIVVSDFLEEDGFGELVDDVKNIPNQIWTKSIRPLDEFTKRSYRDAMETKEMLFDPESDFFTEIINPLGVQTAQLIVGTNSQQMNFIGVRFKPNADGNPNVFRNNAGFLEHFTIDPGGKIRQWSIAASEHVLENSLAYYVYAKCHRTGTQGEIFISEQAITLEQDPDYYHFWVGVLNTPEDSVRSWQPMYGFTEIAGEQITTGVIKDRLTRLVIDLREATIYARNGALISGRILVDKGSSGYDNFEDKPDLSIYGTWDMLNQVTEYLQEQLDGKIETWFQDDDPFYSWDYPEEHEGDMWYNTYEKKLYVYTGHDRWNNPYWEPIEDELAIAAAEAAATAKDTADGKRRVFLEQPYPPYDPGDQWVEPSTQGGDLRVCIRGRESGSYVNTDWILSGVYGNTMASIDRGIFTGSGFMTFGGSGGMVGEGDIRIWSGGESGPNGEPPLESTFRVMDTGAIYAGESIICEDSNRDAVCGFSSEGTNHGSSTDPGSLRIWAGSSFFTKEDAPFRVTMNGTVYTPFINLGNGSHLYSTGLHMPNDGQITLSSSDDEIFIKGMANQSPFGRAVLDIRDISSGTSFYDKSIVLLEGRASGGAHDASRWINCITTGWGSRFVVESRAFGSERTAIDVGQLMNNNQLTSLMGDPDLYPVYWDNNSGYLCAKV